MVALVSEDVPLEILTPPACSSELPSELSSDELDELDELESEEDSGSGVLVAFFRALESAFLEVSFSDSEESESDPELLSELELELELELALEAELELLALLELEESESEPESDSEESELEESELEESELEESELEEFELEEDLEGSSTFLAFLALGASLSELESEEDSLLDSALRFKLAGFLVTGAGAAGASSSFSSSASLSELDEAEDEDEEEEGEEARLAFSSCISTSESLSLSLSVEEDSFLSETLSQLWNNSCREGAFFASADLPAFFRSFSKAVLALEKPLSERNVATAESS